MTREEALAVLDMEAPDVADVPDFILEIEADLADFTEALGLSADAGSWKLSERDLFVDGILKRIAAANAEFARDAAVYSAELTVLNAWHDASEYRRERAVAYLEGLIADVVPRDAETFKAEFAGGKKKSRALPNGTVGFRSSRATVEVISEEFAVAWAKANGIEVKVKETILKKPVVDYILKTGDEPDDGEMMIFVPPTDVFFVKPNEPKDD